MYLWRRSLSRLTDTFYGPIISLFIWGYVSIYFTNKVDTPNLIVVFLGGIDILDCHSKKPAGYIGQLVGRRMEQKSH